MSVAEIVIPCLLQQSGVVFYETLDVAKFAPAEAAAARESNGVEPEFADVSVTFDVYVGRLSPE